MFVAICDIQTSAVLNLFVQEKDFVCCVNSSYSIEWNPYCCRLSTAGFLEIDFVLNCFAWRAILC